MKKFTDDQLLEILNDTESDRVERKESFKGEVPNKARQAVCAFSKGYGMRNSWVQRCITASNR
jgi:ATP-dependent DNA helicase RecG